MDMFSSASVGLAVVCFWQKEFLKDDLMLVILLLAGVAWPSLVPVMVVFSVATGFPIERKFATKLVSAWLNNWRMWMLASSLVACHQRSLLTDFRHFSFIAWVCAASARACMVEAAVEGVADRLGADLHHGSHLELCLLYVHRHNCCRS